MAKPGILVEQLIDELRDVLLRWNTSCLMGNIIIFFRDKSTPEIKYFPQIDMTHILSDLSSTSSQNQIHSNLYVCLGQNVSHSHDLPRQADNLLFTTTPCSQVDGSMLGKDNSQGDFDKHKSTSHSSSSSPRKQWIYPHSSLSQNTPPATSVSLSSDYNHISPLANVSLPPFENIMHVKNSGDAQRGPVTEYQDSSNADIQTLPQTCYNDNDTYPISSHSDVTVTVDCFSITRSHFDENVKTSHGAVSNYHRYREEAFNHVSELSKSSFQHEHFLVNEMKGMKSVYNNNHDALPHNNLPQRQSLDDSVKTNDESNINTRSKHLSDHIFGSHNIYAKENHKKDVPVINFADGSISFEDLIKLSHKDLVAIITDVMQGQDYQVRMPKPFSLSQNSSYASLYNNQDLSDDLKGQNSSKECQPPMISTLVQGDIENHSPSCLKTASTVEVCPNREENEIDVEVMPRAIGKNVADMKHFDKSSSYSDQGQALGQSKHNQNVKPLKKRNRLCTSIRNEFYVKSQDPSGNQVMNRESVTLTEQPNQSDVTDSLPHSSQKQKTVVKTEKTQKKSSSFSCKICMTNFTSRQDYRQHLRSHDGSFKCNVCGKVMKTKDSLYHHQRGLHSKEKPFHCKECNISFNFHHSYKLHIQRHKGERPHKCKYCEKSYLTFYHLKEHVQAIHSKVYIVCHICGKKFSYTSALKLHLRRHSGETPYKCSTCPKKFATKQSLKNHAASHIKERNFQCETCGKCFKTEYSRNAHSLKHKKPSKRFMCDTCGKTFHYKCVLDRHVQIHNKTRSYACTVCDKAFKSKDTLYNHKYNVHKEGLKFSCSTCNKSFKTKGCLKAHVKRHQNSAIYTCSTCGATFPDKGGLNKHMKTIHLPHKCYICKICGKIGTRRDNMRTHVKCHKNEMSFSTNPMDFIIEELAIDRLTEYQSQLVKIGQRTREPKHRSTQKPYPIIQTPDPNRWIQPRPTPVQNVHQMDIRSPATTSSIPVLPLVSHSQGSHSRSSATFPIDDSPALLSQMPKDFDKYTIPMDQGKSTQYLSYYCSTDITGDNDGDTSGNNTNNLTLPTGSLSTLLSTINNVSQEPEAHPPYSFVLSHPSHTYQASRGNLHASEPIMPRSMESLTTPAYGMSHEKTMTTLQNVALAIPLAMEEPQMSNSLQI